MMRGLHCCECYAGALDPLATRGYEAHTADASATLVGTGARPLATAAKIASACPRVERAVSPSDLEGPY